MALVRIQVSDIKKDKPLPFDLVAVSNTLLVPKGTILTRTIADKLEDQEVYIDYEHVILDSNDTDEILSTAKNKLSTLLLGKEVESFHIFVKEANNSVRLLPCAYIGWIKDLSIVAEMPRYGTDVTSRIHQLEPGQKVQAKLQCGKSEYIFQSFVMCVVSNPLPHIHIKHPSQVKTLVFRRAHRKQVSIAAMVDFYNQMHKVAIIDLSDCGCGFISDITFAIEDPIIITFSIPFIDSEVTELKIYFKIKNSTKISGRFRYGGDFTDISLEQRLKLRSYLYTVN